LEVENLKNSLFFSFFDKKIGIDSFSKNIFSFYIFRKYNKNNIIANK